MSDVRNLILLSVLAYREKQFEGAAKLFASAMEHEGLDSFVDYVERMPPVSGMHKSAGESENTLAPSLSSALDEIEAVFRSESSFIEEGDELVESTATGLNDEFEDDADDQLVVIASAGPIKSRKQV